MVFENEAALRKNNLKKSVLVVALPADGRCQIKLDNAQLDPVFRLISKPWANLRVGNVQKPDQQAWKDWGRKRGKAEANYESCLLCPPRFPRGLFSRQQIHTELGWICRILAIKRLASSSDKVIKSLTFCVK